MPLVLARIDDRLIHGQVTVGWGNFLNPDRILLVSDEIAQNEWEMELYQSCVPFNISVSILSVKDAADAMINNSFKDDRVILLAESPAVIAGLLEAGAELRQVNIGGMHHKPNTKKLLPYVYLSEEDIRHFKTMSGRDIELICQDLPQAKKENLAKLLDGR